MEDHERGACACSVGETGSDYDDDERDEIRRCRERLGRERRMTHFVDDGRQEDRHGGEGNVAVEKHELILLARSSRHVGGDAYGSEVAFCVADSTQDITPVDTSSFHLSAFPCRRRRGVSQSKFCDFAFAHGQKTGLFRAVRDDFPGNDCDEHAGEAFDEEEETPGRDGAVFSETCDHVCEAASEGSGKGRG